jgi:hypothetical protein
MSDSGLTGSVLGVRAAASEVAKGLAELRV